MSNSVFTESSIANDEIDSNLVIIVNKNGNVSVDQPTLHSFLENKDTTNTSVSIVRVTSPTPSINDEIAEEEEKMKQELEKDLTTDPEDEADEDASDVASIAATLNNEFDAHVSLTVENFFPPEEARKLANELIKCAGNDNPLKAKQHEHDRSIVFLDHNYMLQIGTDEKKPETSVPEVVTKPKGQQKTMTATASKQKTSTVVSKSRPSKSQSQTDQSVDQSISESTDNEGKEGGDSEEETTESESPTSSDFSENDRDSDLDFNINDRLSTRVKKPGQRGRRPKPSNDRNDRRKSRQSTSAVDREMESIFGEEHHENKETATFGGKKARGGKMARLSKSNSERTVVTTVTSATKPTKNAAEPKNSGGKDILSPSKSDPEATIPTFVVSQPSTSTAAVNHQKEPVKRITIDTITISKPSVSSTVLPPKSDKPKIIIHKNELVMPPLTAIKNVVKKKVHTPNVADTLFTDMPSLFSTPDIIKKVGSGEQQKIHQHHDVIISAPDKPSEPTINNAASVVVGSGGGGGGFITLNPITSKTKLTSISHISIHTHNSAMELASEQDKQLDLIDSIVQQELKEPNPMSASHSNTDIPNIVKMLENSERSLDSSLLMKNVIEHSSAPSASVSNMMVTNHHSSSGDSISDLVSDGALLDTLSNPEDGLTEDLLQHVAELVENKNLQEIIDKQVLGVQHMDRHTMSKSPVLPSAVLESIEQLEQHSQSLNVLLTPISAQSSLSVPVTPISNQKSNTSRTIGAEKSLQLNINSPAARKEPIKIVRSDGRVITLPPIEAPTTRGAKRRAQTNPNESQQSPAPAAKNQKIVVVTTTPIVASTIPEQRKSVDSVGSDVMKSAQKKVQRQKSVSVEKEGKTSRRSSINQQNNLNNSIAAVALSTPGISSAGKQPTPVKKEDFDSDDHMDSDDSWNSEDDPDRLWCICKQPHNNRFMICCDKCEEWFHGKCVNITKAMGQQMEEKGIEWTCPNCIKKRNIQLLNLVPLDHPVKVSDIIDTKKLSTPQPSQQSTESGGQLKCIVCKQQARQNSIYCSDDCIRKHAKNALVTTKTTTNLNLMKSDGVPSPKSNETSKPIVVTATTVATHKPETTSAVTGKMGFLQNKNRVIVFERKTGRCLAGNSAPLLSNLKQWLLDNPTFEVVPPGSAQAEAIRAKQLQLKNLAKADKKPQTTPQPQLKQTQLKIGTHNKLVYVTTQSSSSTTTSSASSATTNPQQKIIVKSVRMPQAQNAKQSVTTTATATTASPSSVQSKTQTVKVSPATVKEVKHAPVKSGNNSRKVSLDRQDSLNKSGGGGGSGGGNEPEPIRVNVKRTLKEQLTARMGEIQSKGSGGPKLTPEEIEQFANDTEAEMFALFNKDTGTKYKAKYRSLMFNIKDRKNTTLFQKICDKSIGPNRLVRMSPEEMASQELAQWREKENKHQLEMIKKSELDLLACTKNYVLKTHKGEEVIESKETDRMEIDPTVAVEDVVSMLNSSAVSSTSDTLISSTAGNIKPRYDKFEKLAMKALDERVDKTMSNSTSTTSSVKKSSKKESRRSRSRSRHESRHSSSKHKKHKSRERRSRSADRSGSGKRKSRSRERTRRSRSKETSSKHKDRESTTKKEKELETAKTTTDRRESHKRDKDVKKVDNKEVVSSGHHHHHHHHSKSTTPTVKEKKLSTTTNIDDYNLVDKILEASAAATTVASQDDNTVVKPKEKPSPIIPETIKKTISIESDQEPSSTVIIQTPPDNLFYNDGSEFDDEEMSDEELWNGSLSMADVGTFHVSLFTLNGDCDEIKHDLPTILDIVGRISPETVWDYLSKIKKSPTKDIILVRFSCSIDTENDMYDTLHEYLHTRRRLGVIKTNSPYIKDFYLYPLPGGDTLPEVLLPVKERRFIDGSDKPDYLIGIIVKIKGKRGGGGFGSTAHLKSKSNSAVPTVVSAIPPAHTKHLLDERFTPPGSPKELVKRRPTSKTSLIDDLPKASSVIAAPIINKDDEPYSPGGSDEDDLMDYSNEKSIIQAPVMNTSLDPEDITKKMDELERQIEAQKMEIAGILIKTSNNSPDLDEPYSPSRPVTPPQSSNLSTLANIAIPSNLSEILASINKNSTMTTADKSTKLNEPDEEYNPDEEYQPIATGTTSSYMSAGGYIPAKSLMTTASTTPSKLAQLTDAELLSMVPDEDAIPRDTTTTTTITSVEKIDDTSSSVKLNDDNKIDTNEYSDEDEAIAFKKARWDLKEPPPPGLEDEYHPI